MCWSCSSTARLLALGAALVLTAGVASAQRAVADEVGAEHGFVGAYDHLPHRPAAAQPDTVWLPSPTGALVRSLAVPGWGQIYNRQWIKAPFVWAGLGTLIGITVYSNNRAVLFRRAAIYIDCIEQPEAVPPEFCEGAEAYLTYFERGDQLTAGPLTAPTARNLRDQFRRQRDLFVLFSFLAYGIQALDAYVAAELADFDLGEDLVINVSAGPQGPGLALRWRF